MPNCYLSNSQELNIENIGSQMSWHELVQIKNKGSCGGGSLTKCGSLDDSFEKVNCGTLYAGDAEKVNEKDKNSLKSPDYSQVDSLHEEIVSVIK